MENLIYKNREKLSDRHYIRKADPNANYWLDFSSRKLDHYISQFGDDFLLIIGGNEAEEGDFYAIPFGMVKHIFTPEYFASDNRKRWIGRIINNELRINNCPITFDLGNYFGNPYFLDLDGKIGAKIRDDSPRYFVDQEQLESDQNDYAIENRKIEIEARQKQSKFRRKVLKNFAYQCCISEITESELLVASHIVPWSKKVETRLDPSNGLCLSVLYDKLFDKGYISFDEEMRVIVTKSRNQLSWDLREILASIEGKLMRKTKSYPIKKEYLSYHRQEVFEKKNENVSS